MGGGCSNFQYVYFRVPVLYFVFCFCNQCGAQDSELLFINVGRPGSKDKKAKVFFKNVNKME